MPPDDSWIKPRTYAEAWSSAGRWESDRAHQCRDFRDGHYDKAEAALRIQSPLSFRWTCRGRLKRVPESYARKSNLDQTGRSRARRGLRR